MIDLKDMKAQVNSLSLIYTRENMEQTLKNAEDKEPTYREFLQTIMESELFFKQNRLKEKRIKEAGFPYVKRIEEYEVGFQNAITERQLKQLAELTWIEGLYNLIPVSYTHLTLPTNREV